ncbi:hypothetical protein SAMN05192558_111126 [Actinokineospora alba]|uniref:Uncharacterized protein n=1 Tax=Actinokineospora alba TaxID=504798 RepID=A0A1H0UE35_9PSEU|nr:hypothetical protein [Actinokineospora alba]TDP65153.1 hypothetical protein C8E96_0632 [Actinokineospora alba]SDH55358.1 hypothetical protein SAMN05421871_101455 [Actinokineospora alba]SDP64552.1 hypothetical protein SAMN05192558_111126 [Actinokineospora alba]
MTWSYCEQWNRVLNKPLGPLDENMARQFHETGETYTAFRDDAGSGRVLIEIRLETGYAATRFIDEQGRDELAYIFMRNGDKLFLQEIVSYEYGQDTGARGRIPLVVESYTFTPGGVVRHRTDDSRVDTIAVEDIDSVDVSAHWEAIPEFGQYDAIAKYGRA